MEQSLVIQIHLILENLKGKAYNEDVRKLAEFLSTKDMETLRKKYEGDSNYMACIRKVEELSTDPEFVGYYDIEEAHKQELADSYNTGYDKGINQRNIENHNRLCDIMNINIMDLEVARKKLEEFHLLTTYYHSDNKFNYIYILHAPLSADSFFNNEILCSLLLKALALLL